jgi:acetyl esterase/lipase
MRYDRYAARLTAAALSKTSRVLRAWQLIAPVAFAAGLAGCGSGGDAPSGVTTLTIGGQYAELGTPEDGAAARGTILLFHKGAWAAEGSGAVGELRPVANRFRSWGWRTLSATYRNGRAGLADVEATYDHAERHWGGGPICAYGESSGGHWALMLALARRRLSCVIAAATPVDLTSWPRELRDPDTRTFVETTLERAFGTDRAGLADLSPALRWQRREEPRLFLAYAHDDPLVPIAQGVEMHERAPGSELHRLPPGSARWIHSQVDPGALERWYDALRQALGGIR